MVKKDGICSWCKKEFSFTRKLRGRLAAYCNPNCRQVAYRARNRKPKRQFWFCEYKKCGKEFKTTNRSRKYCSKVCKTLQGRLINPETDRKAARKYYKKNREKLLENFKQYRRMHRKELREKAILYQKHNETLEHRQRRLEGGRKRYYRLVLIRDVFIKALGKAIKRELKKAKYAKFLRQQIRLGERYGFTTSNAGRDIGPVSNIETKDRSGDTRGTELSLVAG